MTSSMTLILLLVQSDCSVKSPVWSSDQEIEILPRKETRIFASGVDTSRPRFFRVFTYLHIWNENVLWHVMPFNHPSVYKLPSTIKPISSKTGRKVFYRTEGWRLYRTSISHNSNFIPKYPSPFFPRSLTSTADYSACVHASDSLFLSLTSPPSLLGAHPQKRMITNFRERLLSLFLCSEL